LVFDLRTDSENSKVDKRFNLTLLFQILKKFL
jgi:hypothetical protein